MRFQKKMRFSAFDEKAADDMGTVVQRTVADAEYYDDGQLEALRHRHEKLVEIVAMMANSLPEAMQRELADFLNWEVLE